MSITLADLDVGESAPSGRTKINGNNALLEAAVAQLSSRLDMLEKGSGPAGGYNPPTNDGIFVYASPAKIAAGKYTTATRVAQLDMGAILGGNSFLGFIPWGPDAWFVLVQTASNQLTGYRVTLVGGVLSIQATGNIAVANSTYTIAGVVALSPTVVRFIVGNINSVALAVYNATWNGSTGLALTAVATLNPTYLVGTPASGMNNYAGYLVGASSIAIGARANGTPRCPQMIVADRGALNVPLSLSPEQTNSVNANYGSHDNMGGGIIVQGQGTVTPQDNTSRATMYALYVDDTGAVQRSRLRWGDVATQGMSVIALSPTLVAFNFQDSGTIRKFAFAALDPATGALTNLGVFGGGNADSYLFQNVFRFSPLKFYSVRQGATVTGQVMMLAEYVPAPAGLVTNPANDILFDFANGLSATAVQVNNVTKAEGYADRMAIGGRATISSVNRAIFEVYGLT